MSQALSTNSLISHYRIVSKLGAGGMGEVWLAEDTRLGRKVALKLLPAEFTEDSERVRRFTLEAKAASALNHPNIIAVHDIGECETGRFIAMEYVAGRTLRSVIAKDNSLETLFTLGAQMAKALSAAHLAGITHRDIKPDNIMVRDDGYVKMLDFGLARLLPTSSSDPEAMTLAQQTTPGTVMGTLAYMSPEQANVQTHGSAPHGFALGIVLYELATGSHPFKSETMIGYLHAITSQTPASLTSVKSHLPVALNDLILRILENHASDCPTAGKVAQGLQEIEKYGSNKTLPIRVAAPKTKATRGDEGFRIAVLPFKVRDADTDVSVLAEGLSEEIVTGLSRFRYLSVVTSTSSIRLKGDTEDDRALSAKLGTRYVLEGSIRKGGSVIRVSAQLVDTETGAQLWSETYNQDLQTSTVFAVQDDIAGRIVATVADSYGVLVHSMRAAMRKKDDSDLAPVEWQFQYFAYREQITPSAHAALKSRLQRVAERNDGQSDLWACLAQIYVDEYAFGFQGDATSLDRALAAGRRAVELDRANQFALVALAQVHFFRRDLAAFGPAAERGMALNPLNSDALGILGLQIVHTGQFERGTAIVRRAMELNPNHAGWMHFAPLWDHFHRGEYEQALECANRVDVPGLFWPYLVMASACGHLGRRMEAEAAVKDLLALDPEFATHVRSNIESWHFVSGLLEPLLEGLRKAGLEIVDEDRLADVSPSVYASDETRADEGFWIAVLPFKFTGSNPEVATLAEGLSEEIVTGLSRFSYLRVISRSSTLRYAEETDDVRTVGKTLGARYVMEGSLRVAGSSLRISVQLIDANSGAHLWAETYDRQFRAEEVFALQDELVPRIVSTVADVNGVLPRSMSEFVCSKNPDELSPYEAVLRSFRYFDRVTGEELVAARSCLEIAVKKAPSNADAWAMLALLFVQDYGQGFNLRADALNSGALAAQRSVEAGPSNHLAHFSLAQARFFQKDLQSFRNEAERSVALNPMDANALAFVGELFTYVGDYERGLALAARAKEINPNHPGWFWYADYFYAYQHRDYHGALSSVLKANLPGHWGMHAGIAAAAAQLGDDEAARKAISDLLNLKPDFGATVSKDLKKWFDPELREHLIEGLRKAGLEIAGEAESVNVASETRASIAVLPFVNISNDQDNEYFCDGLAEELLNALSKIESLRVAAGTSAFSFKGKETDVREIGTKLNVSTVLEGSVRKSGNRVRISVQLVNAADGYHLWSEKYDHELKDIFDIQDKISLAIVDALKLKLLGTEQTIVKRYTDNTEAYQLYLKGRFFVNQRTSQSLLKAIEYFNQAIALDANYALGYAGLADAYMVLGVPDPVTEALSPIESLTKARAAAEKALEIDTSVGEVYAALAHIKWKERDWVGAENDYRRSIELNPHNPIAHFYYAVCLAGLGRRDEAVKEIRRAQEFDPLSLPVNASVVYVLYLCRRYDEAIEAGKKTLELDASFPLTHQRLGLPYVQKMKYSHAINEFQLAVNSSNRAPQPLISLGHAYAVSGNKVEAQKLLEELGRLSQQRYVSSYGLAAIYVGQGDKEQALGWLEKAFEEDNTELTFLKVDPRLDPLREDPRFQTLLKKVGFPE